MSAKEETVPTNVESGDAEVAVKALAREKQPVAKNTKEVKANKLAAKAPKKKTSAPNPTYEEMIKDAITTLKERTGSSQYAIQKFIEEKQKSLPPTFRKLLLVNLKRLVASEKLVKVKGSFKLPSAKPSTSAPVKKPAAKASKKPAAAKPKAEVVKASRTSSRTSQGKKAADAEPAVVGTEKAPAKREFIWTFPYL